MRASITVLPGDGVGPEVIAEGVEKQAQLDLLQAQGCHLYQGYLFSHPLPLSDFGNLLKVHSSS